MSRVDGYGGSTASTCTTWRQACAWDLDTTATSGGVLPGRAASRRAADTALSGGRWSVCTTGARSPVASLTAGASKAWLWITSYRPDRTAAKAVAKAASAAGAEESADPNAR